MFARSRYLFETQLARSTRRVDMVVISLVYVVLGLVQILTVWQFSPRQSGIELLHALTVLHAAMAALLGMRLAGDVAGDRSSGMVGLLFLSGVSAGTVVLAQWMHLLAVFIRIWIIRCPLLMLAYSLGGTTWTQILMAEALLIGIFVLTVSLGLLVSHYSSDRTVLRGIFPFTWGIDLLLTIPSLVMGLLSYPLIQNSILNWPQGASAMAGLNGAADWLLSFRVTTNLALILNVPQPAWGCLRPLVVHLGLAVVCVWCWRRVYFTCLDEAVTGGSEARSQAAEGDSEWKSPSRSSRPVWDDALAWQAYYIHSRGHSNTRVRSLLLIGILSTVLVLMLSGQGELRSVSEVILIASSALLLLMGQSKVSDCLQKEIRELTIASLLMTPHTPLELCDGWNRGARRLQRLDPILVVACLASCLWVSPNEVAPSICVGGIMMLACSPFFVLSPLIPYSFRGIMVGLFLIAIPFWALGIVAGIMHEVHFWMGVIVVIPLAFGWNRLCRWMIPRWFEKKVVELV